MNPASTLTIIRNPIVDTKTGMATWELKKKLQEWDTKLNNALTLIGQIASNAVIQGRTEGIGTTVGQITSTGLLSNADKVAADGVSFVRVTPTQRTGGGRAAIALDANNRLAGTFRSNGVNVASVPLSSTVLSNDGISTAIPISASTNQFGDGQVSYNSGSVDPGVFGGPVYVYADDPTFAGGAVAYQFSTTQVNQAAANGRVLFGSITTVNGSAKTGGGSTGGTGGGRGGRQYL